MATSISEQLRMKLALERRFKPEIKKVFAAILKDFRSSIAVTGMPPQARRYLPAWSTILDGHYRRTQKLFTGAALSSQKQKEEESDAEILALALLAWRDQNVSKHAELLTSTTQTNMSEALQMAGEQFAQEGEIPSKRELAAAAVVILRRKFKGRVNSIAMSETQAAAESTKFTEVEIASDLTPRVLGGGLVITTTIKVWRTVGDSKVRPIHMAVNGQRRQLTEPYVVNNQFLMYPGDSSLGASADNVANCRCISQYNLK